MLLQSVTCPYFLDGLKNIIYTILQDLNAINIDIIRV